jgi:P pilus assembly chaperone PapD
MKQKYALRRALPVLVAAVLLTAIFIDAVAAGVKAVSSRSRVSYPASGGAVTVSVPNSMKAFPAELLPQ